ncbi:MAG: NAD(P)/FAD-dependent oxidoreductase [Amylibacter sp.]
MTPPKKPDLIVIGAGPAGLAAASQAASHGAQVMLLDEQSAPGGQIYRNILSASAQQDIILGSDYTDGRPLAADIDTKNIDYRPNATVWNVGTDGSVTFTQNGVAQQVYGRHILLANGALERPTPLPGWTLPGVMTAGAAQILLKTSGLVARDAVLAGSGPLLYLIAAQMIAAGRPPKALIETQTSNQFRSAISHIGGAIYCWKQLLKGLKLIAIIRKAGVVRYKGASNIEILGAKRAQAISFTVKGRTRRIETDVVLLHQGVVPNTQITRSLRLKHRWDEKQRCFYPATDAFGQSSSKTISIAGDGAGILGAKVAEYSGRIAASNALVLLDIISPAIRDKETRILRRSCTKEAAIRPFLDALYAPPPEILSPKGKTIVCRCEEVTADDIRSYVALGCKGPNQTKAFGRSGMGPCQGRYCGATVTEILAAETGIHPERIGSYRIRAPLKPITLGELASLETVSEKEITS